MIPKSRRRSCLFKKSCSCFVYETTANRGLMAGLKALQYRMDACKHGSYLYINPYSGKAEMVLPNNDIICHDEIAERLLINCHVVKT